MKKMMHDRMVAVMLIVIIFSGITIVRLINNNYTREDVIVAIHTSTREVIIVGTTGNEQFFYGVGYKEGDTITMNNSNTDNIINDDVIKNVTVNTY